MKNKFNEVYWVTSDGEEPKQIFFNAVDALDSGERYIDSFDKEGKVCRRMKKIGDGNYTTKF